MSRFLLFITLCQRLKPIDVELNQCSRILDPFRIVVLCLFYFFCSRVRNFDHVRSIFAIVLFSASLALLLPKPSITAHEPRCKRQFIFDVVGVRIEISQNLLYLPHKRLIVQVYIYIDVGKQ